MNHINKPTWEQIRGQGKSRFILSGLVQRGFKIAAPYTIGFFITDLLGHRVTNPVAEAFFLIKTYLLLTLLVGWLEGAYVWFKNERNYKKAALKRHARR
ncbi:MAG TPA: hypothetical protein VG347_20825 [Verrucomicrobiae bacterium]|nr:hypothetical protein [Verrucomicrobiae bacterium]